MIVTVAVERLEDGSSILPTSTMNNWFIYESLTAKGTEPWRMGKVYKTYLFDTGLTFFGNNKQLRELKYSFERVENKMLFDGVLLDVR